MSILNLTVNRKHRMTKMSGRGDETVAEWDLDVTSEKELEKIEAEFNQKLKEGYFAANLETNELIRDFDENASILLIPRMAGG